jgi:hypothetical protein
VCITTNKKTTILVSGGQNGRLFSSSEIQHPEIGHLVNETFEKKVRKCLQAKKLNAKMRTHEN